MYTGVEQGHRQLGHRQTWMEKYGRTELGTDQIILMISAFVRNLANWSRILNCKCTGIVGF